MIYKNIPRSKKAKNCGFHNRYIPVVEITTDQFTGEKITVTRVASRGLVDDYSNLFQCLFAKFYETMLLKSYIMADIHYLMTLRENFKINDIRVPEQLFGEDETNKRCKCKLVRDLLAMVNQEGIYPKMCTIVGEYVGIKPVVFANFLKDIATAELHFLCSYFNSWERMNLFDRIVASYAKPNENKYLSAGNTLAQFHLREKLDFLGTLVD